MKFHNLVLNILLLVILSSVSRESVTTVKRFSNANKEIAMQLNATKFISESFKNTCKGKGFKNLEEWQKNCKALFYLDYIGFSEMNEFLEEKKNYTGISEGKTVVYGKWTSSYCSGDVFCKVMN